MERGKLGEGVLIRVALNTGSAAAIFTGEVAAGKRLTAVITLGGQEALNATL